MPDIFDEVVGEIDKAAGKGAGKEGTAGAEGAKAGAEGAAGKEGDSGKRIHTYSDDFEKEFEKRNA